MILAIFGPPGAGKGTQSPWLCERLGLEHVSTGDLLRAEIRAGGEFAQEAEAVINRGDLVSDDLVRRMVSRQAGAILKGGRGILFDGYPRNLSQLQDVDTILGRLNARIDLAVFFDIEDEIIVSRLGMRRICEGCSRVYNLDTSPPENDGVCDDCGRKLIEREDDNPEVVRRRLSEYRRQTEPLIQTLHADGRLHTVSADGSIDAVRSRLESIIQEAEGIRSRGV